MGLLDTQQSNGLMDFGMGLLSAGAPSRMPVGLGQAMGQGMQQMQAGNQQRQAMQMMDMQMQNQGMQLQQHQMQIEQAKKAIADNEMAKAKLGQYVQSLPDTDPNKAQIVQAVQMGVPMHEVWKKINPDQKYEKSFDAQGREVYGFVSPGQPFKQVGGSKIEQMPWEYQTNPITGLPEMKQGVIDAKKAVAKSGAPSMTSINNVNAFEPFKNKIQTNMAESLIKNYDALQGIPQTLQALDSAKLNLSKAGGFVGSGAESKLAVAKFFNNNLGTNIDPVGIKNTEALQSALFYNVMDNLKKMDASPSQQQQEVMQKAFGKITTDPAALPMIIDFYRDQVLSKAREHNRRVDETTTGASGIKFPYDIHVRTESNGQQNSVPAMGTVRKYNPSTGKIE